MKVYSYGSLLASINGYEVSGTYSFLLLGVYLKGSMNFSYFNGGIVARSEFLKSKSECYIQSKSPLTFIGWFYKLSLLPTFNRP